MFQKESRSNSYYCSESTLKPYRYIVKILRSATSEVRNKHVLQKQKKCVGKIKSGVIKMYGMYQGKGIYLKKEIKIEMTEHVCSRKYVCPSKGIFHLEILWNRSKWSVVEPSAVTIPENIWRPTGGHSKEKRSGILSPLRLPAPEMRSMERTRTSAIRARLEKICIPGRIQARGRKEKANKNGDPHRN